MNRMELPATTAERVLGMIELRDIVQELLQAQLDDQSDAEVASIQRRLNRRYDEFIYKMYEGRVMTIDKDHLDFQHNPKDFAQIVDRIDRTLFGLFPDISNNDDKH